MSDLGSHCGFKAITERNAAGASALFATVASFGAGRICDFASRLYAEGGHVYFKKPRYRKVRFYPYMIEEKAGDGSFTMTSRLYFVQHNLAVYETEWETGEVAAVIKPALRLKPTLGRDLENPYPHFNGFTSFSIINGGVRMSSLHRLPGLKMHALFLPSTGSARDKKEIQAPWMEIKAGQKIKWAVVISFSANGTGNLACRAERALRNLKRLRSGTDKRCRRFEENLPLPCEADSAPAKAVMNLAAWALQNSLYRPRAKMRRWGSVPAKVYFPFIWGWDTPQHVLGLCEWNPKKAGDVLLTQLDGNLHAPRRARFRLKAKGVTIISGTQRNLIPSKLNDYLRGVLDFYSQPPLQSWAAVRVYERMKNPGEKKQFLAEVLPPLMDNLAWWEESRKLKNGFFSYLNGLESGLDDSPRFYPPSFLPSFIIGLVPRFFSAIDLNCWIYQSYKNISYLCFQDGRLEQADAYRALSTNLKNRIDEELWSEKHKAWLDRRNGKFIEVITPTVWWPAFVGATSDLNKVQSVIENYLLNPGKFWGRHGIPSVAFDDKAYNSRKDGYYWRGQIWMINNYSALEVLYRFGYTKEALELHGRILKTMHASPGLYETYNAQTGDIGWSSRGPGDPAVMQFGMSSAWATQMLCCRYQHFRYIFAETRELVGHIKWAAGFDCVTVHSPPGIEAHPQNPVLLVEAAGEHSYDVPKLVLKSTDGRPLVDSSLLSLRLENPAGSLDPGSEIVFTWQGERYKVKLDKNYLLRPYASEDKLVSA